MPLKTAVVGAGVVSGVHLSGLSNNPRTDLVAVCDLDADRAREAAAEYGVESYTDLEELLAGESLDWLHVCTPVGSHLEVATRAIEAGIPVLIEKPVTETVEELDRLRSTADENGVRAAVVHNQVYDPAVRRARAAIEAGRLGPVRGVDLVFTDMTTPDERKRGSWARELPGGEFEEGLPHPIYLTLELGGVPAGEDDVSATTALRREYEEDFSYDEAGFQYVTAGGAVCSATVRAGAVPQRHLVVHGERESLVVDVLSQTVVTLDRDYAGSAVSRALNNLDHAGDRLLGTARNAVAFGRTKVDDDWATRKATNSHYYLFDEEVRAIAGVADVDDGLRRARWTMTILQAIRDAPRRAVGASA